MSPVTNYCEAILGENFEAKKSLRLIPALSNCSDALLDLIFTYSKPVKLTPGEVLIEEGMFDQWIYFLVDGILEVSVEGRVLGMTSGPMVGERCIMGEPRGAKLIAGEKGVMALGIEMSVVDEINRQINNFAQTHENEKKAIIYRNEKLQLNLELEAIILNEVILRILDLSRTSFQVIGQLSRALIARETGVKCRPEEEKEDEIEDQRIHHVLQTDFEVFFQNVYDALIKNPTQGEKIRAVSRRDWTNIFLLEAGGSTVLLMDGFKTLNQVYGIEYGDISEMIILIFEITSQYTVKLNGSLDHILSLFEDDEEKKGALKQAEKSDVSNAVIEARVSTLKSKLFQPIEDALQSGQTSELENAVAKMSQDDIDALFG